MARTRPALVWVFVVTASIGACRATKNDGSGNGDSAQSTWYVRPGAAGDGSSWDHALDRLPSSLRRGSVYWLSAGEYGSRDFDDEGKEDLRILLRKATAQAHGSDAGWRSHYGNGQAVFGPIRFDESYYTVDGGEPEGIRVVGELGTEAAVHIKGSHVVLRQVEIDGGFRKVAGRQTAGACNGSNVEGDYASFDRCDIHNVADDGLGIYADYVRVSSSKIHNLDGCGTDGGCGPCYNGHSDGVELSGSAGVELVGNFIYNVRSNAALFMGDWTGSAAQDLLVFNNVFYTPDTGFAVYVQQVNGARIYNNIIWGKTQGSHYGGLSIGQDVDRLDMRNNIILNINFSHMGAQYDPKRHQLDYNLFGMVHPDEYSPSAHDLVADPRFAGVPMSGAAADHIADEVGLRDFQTTSPNVVDTGTAPSGVTARDIAGRGRPLGKAWDRGPFESSPGRPATVKPKGNL